MYDIITIIILVCAHILYILKETVRWGEVLMRDWLIQHRKSKQLTQQQVASLCFIERSYYSQIEGGKRNPSTHVAKNIARVLGFNPLKFFQNDLELSFNEYNNLKMNDEFRYDIDRWFNRVDRGSMLYLYQDEKQQKKFLKWYLLMVTKKKRFCFIIENKINASYIKQLGEIIFKNEENLNNIYYTSFEIHKQEVFKDTIECILKEIKLQVDKNEEIYIWVQYHEKINQFICDTINGVFKNYKLVFIHVYNGLNITAAEYMNLMRQYPLLMTETEVVYSPFYQK